MDIGSKWRIFILQSYNKCFCNLVAGQTYEEENTDLLTGWGVNFTEPYFLQLQNAANTYAESFEYKHTLLSYIGRINYNYDERYLFSATVRRDGSSRLSQNIRWGTFPSVSVGWRFDKESFFPFNRNIVKHVQRYAPAMVNSVNETSVNTCIRL